MAIQIVNRSIVFSLSGSSLWGLGGPTSANYLFDQLTFTPQGFAFDDQVQGGVPFSDATIGMDYSIAVSNLRLGMPLELGVSLGAFDLNYRAGSARLNTQRPEISGLAAV